MWYFSWLLGLPLAAAFAVLNAMWFEMREDGRLFIGEGVGCFPVSALDDFHA